MDEELDVDVESAEDVPDIGVEATAGTYDEGFHDSEDGGEGGEGKSDKREHHNLLERRRRDHIKESFYDLRDCLPQLRGEKVSRAHILNKATEYIRNMQKCGSSREVHTDIDSLKLRNEILEQQIKALERQKTAGSGKNAEEILEEVQEEVIARHREDLQKQTKKINSLVSEKNDGEGVRSGGGIKSRVTNAVKKAPSVAPITPVTMVTPEPGPPLSSPAISLLASNLKSTQNLLTALQKSLPPNANLPANIKTLAQRVLANPLARTQLQASASNAFRGVVTATTVTSKPSTTPQIQPVPPQVTSQTPIDVKPPPPLVNATQVKLETLTETVRSKKPLASKPPQDLTPAALISALTMPVTNTQTPSQLSPQQILRTAHLLLQQQGSTLTSSPEKTNALPPEILAQVSSYLNLPAAITSEHSLGSGAEMLPLEEDSVAVTNSFLTAALTGGMTAALANAETSEAEDYSHTQSPKPLKRAGSCSEEDTEQTTKKPRVVL
ncbi:mucin-2-like isoform X3 [Halichondria panicea]|uniref:mucin-2-like isoform X3 n=1 Tax=Halichondria panicea TaxID=6063 RepID=UPI00312B53C8